MAREKVAVVCLYGVAEWNVECDFNMLRYLSEVAHFVRGLGMDQIILCGGKTNKNVDLSEAKWASKFFTDERRMLIGWPRITLEEKSKTTKENLRNVKRFLRYEDKIFIFCESSRRNKVHLAAQEELPGLNITVISCDFDLKDKCQAYA